MQTGARRKLNATYLSRNCPLLGGGVEIIYVDGSARTVVLPHSPLSKTKSGSSFHDQVGRHVLALQHALDHCWGVFEEIEQGLDCVLRLVKALPSDNDLKSLGAILETQELVDRHAKLELQNVIHDDAFVYRVIMKELEACRGNLVQMGGAFVFD